MGVLLNDNVKQERPRAMIANCILAVALACPHTFTWCCNTAPTGSTQFSATIAIPTTEPANSAEYAWVMAENTETMFTQVGWVWFAAGTGLTVNGLPVPTGSPYLFAYTTVNQGNGDNLGAGGTFTIGPALTPGTSLTVDIARSGDWYGDEALLGGTWTVVQTATLTADPTWMTSAESWGTMTPLCFMNRMYYAHGWMTLPAECPAN
jgi:hypothetical protein